MLRVVTRICELYPLSHKFFNLLTHNAFCANILFVTVLPSPSHHIWNEALVEGLLANGHNITMIGYEDPRIKSENYTVLKLDEMNISDEDIDLMMNEIGILQELLMTWMMTVEMVPDQLKSNALKTLMDYPRNHFDLIVYDIANSQVLYPLSAYFGNVPVIAVSPFGIPTYIAETVGNHFYSYFPVYCLPYTDDMTFVQRLHNAFVYFAAYCLKLYYTPIFYKMAQSKFGEDIVPLEVSEKQIALLLANYDPILDFPQPLPPHVIPVGGLNIKSAKKLPEDFHQLDKAEHGVIYFSLGSNILPSWWANERKQIFIKTFAKLKETVLWKYDGDDLENVPENVIIRKWCPQNDILGHKNVKLFITHNGALSTHESIYHGIPILGIPFFMDQINNAVKIEAKMIGKKVNFNTLTEDILYETIQEILQNPVYRNNVEKLSVQFRDRQETPLERSVFWVEYVLRHKDVKNLSTQGRYMSFFAREYIDIIGFITLSLFLLGYVFVFMLKTIVRRCIPRKAVKIKQN